MHPGCFDLQRVEGGSSKVEWYFGKEITSGITSGMRDKVRQGTLFSSNCVYKNMICLLVYHLGHLLFYISCIV